MNIFVLNVGSSSIKSSFFLFDSYPAFFKAPLWEAEIRWKNDFDTPFLKLKKDATEETAELNVQTKQEAIRVLLGHLFQGPFSVLCSLEEIDCIGHRIVQGLEISSCSLISQEIKEQIKRASDFAPLHNESQLEVIEIIEKSIPNKPQYAVFDTAFHKTLLEESKRYPIPLKCYEEGIYRYGFHGISFQYCSKRAAFLLKRPLKDLKTVICHLGSGASLCALQDGKSIDTTMGFTPLEGLMMDSRSGTIDPGILLYLLRKGKTEKEISEMLYHQSGLLGLSGVSSDMRNVLEASKNGNSNASFAVDVYLHRLSGLIAAMVASLNGIDLLVFTGGIGENSAEIREKVCKKLSFLGVQIEAKKNEESSGEDRSLSTLESRVEVLVIHTQESFEIACECFQSNKN